MRQNVCCRPAKTRRISKYLIFYFLFLCSFALFMIRSDHMIWWYYIMWRYHVAACGKTTKRKRKCHGIVVLPLAQSHQHPMINLEFLIRIHDVDVVIQHFNEKNSGKKIICIAEIFNFLCYPVKLNHVQAAAKQLCNADNTSVTERKSRGGRKKKKNLSLLSRWHGGGFCYYAQRWGELLQSKFLFVRRQFTTWQ